MVYFIRQAGSNYVKIGYTSGEEATARIASLQTANPRRLEVLAIINGDESTEAYYHRKYWQYKTDGGMEWFEMPPSVIEELKGLYHEQQSNDNHCGIEGPSPYDVRPLRWGQQYPITEQREDVPGRTAAFDRPLDQRLFSALRRKR